MKKLPLFAIIFFSAIVNFMPIFNQTMLPASAAEISGNISAISISTGRTFPYAGQDIELYDANGQLIYSYATNENGEFYMYNVPIGTYELRINGEIIQKINIIRDDQIIPIQYEYRL